MKCLYFVITIRNNSHLRLRTGRILQNTEPSNWFNEVELLIAFLYFCISVMEWNHCSVHEKRVLIAYTYNENPDQLAQRTGSSLSY